MRSRIRGRPRLRRQPGRLRPDRRRDAGDARADHGPRARSSTLKPWPGRPPKLLKEAFSLRKGARARWRTKAGGEYFAMRVVKITPPTARPVADIRPQLVQAYLQEAVLDRLTALATQLTQKIQHGGGLEATAASAHAQVKALPDVTRQALVQSRQMDPQVIAALFNAKSGRGGQRPAGPAASIVARVDDIRAGDGRPGRAPDRAGVAAIQRRHLAGHDRGGARPRHRRRQAGGRHCRCAPSAGGDRGRDGAERRQTQARARALSTEPCLDDFRGAYAAGRPQIVWRRIVDDLETPVSAYLKIAPRRAVRLPVRIRRRRRLARALLGHHASPGPRLALPRRPGRDRARARTSPAGRFTPEPGGALDSLRDLSPLAARAAERPAARWRPAFSARSAMT